MMRLVHILFEHGSDGKPFGSATIRLLRPFTHPALHQSIEATAGFDYDERPVDGVILDRLWRPDVSIELIEQLIERVRRAKARLIYALDDNFLDLPQSVASWFTTRHRELVEHCLRRADGVMVTTPGLAQRFAEYNSNIVVVPHALDERLIARRRRSIVERWRESRVVIGYMGTFSHDDDLLMILPALRTIAQRYADRIEFQVVGVAERAQTHEALRQLNARVIPLQPDKVEYTRFMPWFTQLNWDIALAPLIDSVFTRCKSDIKFLDYSALGAAGIYSRMPVYEPTVQHMETGWLAENTVEAWTTALAKLIIDTTLRRRIAQNASQYLRAKRVLARAAPTWSNAIARLLEGG